MKKSTFAFRALAFGVSTLTIAKPASSAGNMKSAVGGAAYYANDIPCFRFEESFQITNRCNASPNDGRYWTIDVESAAGPKTLSVYGRSQQGTTSCAGIVLTPQGLIEEWTLHQSLPAAGGWFVFGALWVAEGQAVQYECFITNTVVDYEHDYISNVRGF